MDGKRLKKARTVVDPLTTYSVQEAAKLIAQFPPAKFDESVDIVDIANEMLYYLGRYLL